MPDMSRPQNDLINAATVGGNVAFSPSVKTNKEDEHPAVSEGECKQGLNVA